MGAVSVNGDGVCGGRWVSTSFSGLVKQTRCCVYCVKMRSSRKSGEFSEMGQTSPFEAV